MCVRQMKCRRLVQHPQSTHKAHDFSYMCVCVCVCVCECVQNCLYCIARAFDMPTLAFIRVPVLVDVCAGVCVPCVWVCACSCVCCMGVCVLMRLRFGLWAKKLKRIKQTAPQATTGALSARTCNTHTHTHIQPRAP